MSDSLAALLGLEQQLRKAASLAQLSFTIVNQTQRCVPYTQAVLLLGSGLRDLRVFAASDIASVDYTSPYVSWIERLARARAADDSAATQVATTVRDADTALQAEWREMAPEHLLWQPLPVEARGGKPAGVLLLFRDRGWNDAEMGLCTHLAASIGHALFALRRRDPLTEVRRHLRGGRTGIFTALALLAALAWPVRLSTLAPVEVIARDPLVISAPMDGAIREIKVVPNQPVAEGDVLATLEDTALSSELEVARRALFVAQAELRTAQQSGFLDPTQKARVAELEAQVRLRQAQLDYAQGRFDRATIRAPGTGVAVLGDPNEWKGRPVRVGERILLVARPEQVELQVMLAVKDSIALAEGGELKVFFDSDPLDAHHAVLRHAAYEPQRTPEDVLAYRLVAALAAADGAAPPRIGMRGTARIYGERVSLFFYLFRRPITSLRQWLGW